MLSFSFFSRRNRQDKTRDLGELHSSELDQVFSFKYLKKKYFKTRATICICEHGTGCLADAGLDPNSGGSDIQTMDRKVRR